MVRLGESLDKLQQERLDTRMNLACYE